MKKLVYILFLFLLVGCNDLSNTPTKKTEEFLKKYQTLDESVINDLENVVNESDLNDEQKTIYIDIMKKQYQSLSYEVKDETLNGDEAITAVEISVIDFKKVLDEANDYLKNNEEEFYDNGEYSIVKFNDYKLNKLKQAKDKVRYTIEIKLTKINDKWTVDNLSNETYDKINGVYNY